MEFGNLSIPSALDMSVLPLPTCLPSVPRGAIVKALVPWPALTTQTMPTSATAHVTRPCHFRFQSLCFDLSFAFPWLWDLGALSESLVHLCSFWVLPLEYTHQAPLLEVKTAVFIPLEAGPEGCPRSACHFLPSPPGFVGFQSSLATENDFLQFHHYGLG